MTEPAPRYATPRTDRPTRGRAVAKVAAALGQPLMPWQRLVADTCLEYEPDGSPSYATVVVTVPRQSGKTTLTRALAVTRSLQVADHAAWYTAQTRNSARDRFMDAIRLLRRGPLAPYTQIRLTNGSEEVSWPNGSRWRLFAPQPDALHGETVDLVVIDEAWAHDDVRGSELLQAAIPAGATRPAFQTWIVSTAGDASSTWLQGFVDAGRAAAQAGARHGIAYVEWSAPSGDPAAVTAAHPALGHTIDATAIATAADTLPAGEFARAYGNLWTSAGERALPAEPWQACQEPLEPPHGPPAAVALDVAPDRSAAAVVTAWRLPDGRPAVAVAAAGPGTEWVAAHVERLCDRFDAPVTYDDMSPAAALADLWPADVRRRTMGTRDVVTAAQQLYDAVLAGRLAIRPDDALDGAAAAAVTRPVGDAWTWGRRKSAADITSLVAATCGLWALEHPPHTPTLLT